MKSLSLRLSVLVVSLACIEQSKSTLYMWTNCPSMYIALCCSASDCDDGMLMPEDWSGSGYSDLLTPGNK